MGEAQKPGPLFGAEAADGKSGRTTGHLFARQRDESKRPLNSERIAADLAAFQRAGGEIEVLGTTHVLSRIAEHAGPAPARRSSGSRRTPG